MDLGPDRRAERHRPGGNVARTRPPCASPKPRRPAEANAWPDPRGLAGPKTWGSSGHVSSRPHSSSMPVAVAPRIAKRVHLHDCQLSALRAPTGLPCSDSQRLRRKKPPKEFQGSLDQPRARKDGAPGVASGSPRRRVVAAARRTANRSPITAPLADRRVAERANHGVVLRCATPESLRSFRKPTFGDFRRRANRARIEAAKRSFRPRTRGVFDRESDSRCATIGVTSAVSPAAQIPAAAEGVRLRRRQGWEPTRPCGNAASVRVTSAGRPP